jgi:hypothetical protein
MRFWLWRAPLAALLAVVTVIGTLRAQEGGQEPGAAPPTRPDGKWFNYGPVEVQEGMQPARRTPVCSFLRALNVGCYSTMHSAGCGNLHTECLYIFGSCHNWYGEPCKAAPQHGIGTGAYGPQPGYGSSGTAAERAAAAADRAANGDRPAAGVGPYGTPGCNCGF